MNKEIFEIKNSEVSISVLSALDKNPEIEENILEFISLLTDLENQDKEYEKLFSEVLKSDARSAADELIEKYLYPVVKLGVEVSDYLVTNKRFTNKRSERKDIVEKLYGDRPEFQDFLACEKIEDTLERKGVSAQKVLRRWIRIQHILKMLTEIEDELYENFPYSRKLLTVYKNKYEISK